MYESYLGSGATLQPDVLFTPIRNIYPTAKGGTLATLGAAGSPDSYRVGMMSTTQSEGGTASGATAVDATGAGGGSLAWWVGVGLIVVLMLFAARKSGNADEFKNLRASTYNVLFITLVAILGLTAAKVLAVRMQRIGPLSGLSNVILAA